MFRKFHHLPFRQSLTAKTFLATGILGLLIWTATDQFATDTTSNAFTSRLQSTLDQKSIDYRFFFGRYVRAHRQAVKVFSTHKTLIDHIKTLHWLPGKPFAKKIYQQSPPWLPKTSTQRSLVAPRFALLLDGQGQIRESYQYNSIQLPAFLDPPGDRLLKLSSNQEYLISHNNIPYVIASTTIDFPMTNGPATLFLASPIDAQFLRSSQGSTMQEMLVAIADDNGRFILASTDPSIIPTGTTIESLQDDYLISESDFYEYGSSEMDFIFVSLISMAQINPLVDEVVKNDRLRRALVAITFIMAFAVIILLLTRRISRLTRRIENFCEQSLGKELTDEISQKDQLGTLEDKFQQLTEEVISSHQTIRLESAEKARLLEITKSETEKKKLRSQLAQAQKMESIGRLAGGIAHDFNNILTAIIGYSEMTIHNLKPDDENLEYLNIVLDSGHRAAALTKQLLAFSRKQVLEVQLLKLNVIIGNLGKMLERLIGEDITLEIKPGNQIKEVLADPGQIEQILMNLVVNARDAMPSGGLITIETTMAELDDTEVDKDQEATPGDYCVISVSDTGSGIPAEHQAKIFEPFFTTKKAGEGTGLGLATVYGITKQHQGFVTLDSKPDKGTTFKIHLPAAKVKWENLTKTEEVEARHGSETILVVEDDDIVNKLILSILKPLGYTLLMAHNGEEALQKIQENKYAIDVLLTDVVMPGISGRELSETVLASHPETKVILMSGYSNEIMDKHGVFKLDFTFVQKPLTPQKLYAALNKELGQEATQDD